MRRTVATLLVVASPLLLAAPVSAQQDQPAPAVAAVPSAPPAVQGVAPTAPAPVTLAPPAAPAPAAAAAIIPPAAPMVHPTVKPALRAKAPAAADVNDAAYAARLQADLCQARQVFCGLDRSGHYPAG